MNISGAHIPQVLDDFAAISRSKASTKDLEEMENMEPMSPLAQRIIKVSEQVTTMKKYLPGTQAYKIDKEEQKEEREQNDEHKPHMLTRSLVKQQAQNAAGYKIFKMIYIVLFVWFCLTTVLCVYVGQQYFNSVLPAMRDIYSQFGTVQRVEAEFVAFVEKNLMTSIETLNHAVQLAAWREPLDFTGLELLLTPILVSQPAVYMLQLGFQGDKKSVTQGGIIYRRIGPKDHIVMQSDLYPSCISIGIFGCSRNLTIAGSPWYNRLHKVDLAQIIVQTQIDPLLDPGVQTSVIDMPEPCVEDDPIGSMIGGYGFGSGLNSTDVNLTYKEQFEMCEIEIDRLISSNCTQTTTPMPIIIQSMQNMGGTGTGTGMSQQQTGAMGMNTNTTAAGNTMAIQNTSMAANFTSTGMVEQKGTDCSKIPVYDGPRKTPQELQAETLATRNYVFNADFQRSIYAEWSNPLIELMSTLDTQIASDGDAFYFAPVISKIFKIQFPKLPDNVDSGTGADSSDLMSTAGQTIDFLLGKISMDVSRFHSQLTDPFYDSEFASIYIIADDGIIVSSRDLSSQISKGSEVTFKYIWEVEGYDTVTANDLMPPADGSGVKDVIIDDIVLHPIRTRRVNRFWVVMKADHNAMRDSWVYGCSWIIITLGIFPYVVFIINTILTALREKALKDKDRKREFALAEAKQTLGAVQLATGQDYLMISGRSTISDGTGLMINGFEYSYLSYILIRNY